MVASGHEDSTPRLGVRDPVGAVGFFFCRVAAFWNWVGEKSGCI